jgi:hypothetical protein
MTNMSASITGGGSGYATVTAVATGVDTLVYINTNSCGTATVKQIVTLNPAPATGTISGGSTLCSTGSVTLSSSVSGGYWGTSNTDAYIDGSGLLTGVAPGIDTVTYTVSTGPACTASTTSVVTIEAAPDPGTISGPTTVCLLAEITLTETVTGGTWSASNANGTVSGGGAISGVAPGLDTFYYSVTNSCGTVTASQIVLIDPCGALGGQVSKAAPGMDVFPNPASQSLNVKWNDLQAGNVDFSMADVTGRIVASFTLPNGSGSGSLQLNIANVEEGVYVISFKSGSDHYTKKLVVTR